MIKRMNTRQSRTESRGQSFVELALTLPLLLIMVVGMLEIVFAFNDYMQMIDGTRNGARASADTNPYPKNSTLYDDGEDCSSTGYFFRVVGCNTATYLKPIDIDREGYGTVEAGSPACINKDTEPDKFTNDIVVTLFSTSLLNSDVDGSGPLTAPSVEIKRFDDNAWVSPADPYLVEDTDSSGWSYMRDQYSYTGGSGTARGMCSALSTAQIRNWLVGGNDGSIAAPNNGYLLVEVFYRHYQLFDAPIFGDVFPNPINLYSYAIFSNSATEATATP
jgi:Flp pilus assembly protein TadG